MGRDGEVLRVTSNRLTDKHAVGTVAELIGILDDVQAVAIVIAAVHPVVHIVPPALDVPVLCETVSIPIGRRSTGVVLHGVRTPVVLLGIAGRAAPADPLAVPIRELHQEQHVYIPHLGKVQLPDVGPQVVDLGSCRAPSDAHLLGLVGLRLVGAICAVIPGDVGEVQLAQTVPTVHIHRVNMEPFHGAVCDLKLQFLTALAPLVPILGFLHHHAARPGDLGHVLPRVQVVKGRGAGAVVHRRVGVPKARRSVGALTLGGAAAGPVPFHAVDGHELSIDCYLLIGPSQIVGSRSYFNSNCSRAGDVIYTVHRNLAGLLIDVTDRSHINIIGNGRDHAVALSGHGKLGASGAGIQRHTCRTYRYDLIALADSPGSCLGVHRAIPPLMVGIRCKGGSVPCAGVDLRLYRYRHFVWIIIGVPHRSFGVPIILQSSALGGNLGDGSSADAPLNGFIGRRTVRPHAIQKNKCGRVGAGIGLCGHLHFGIHLVKVIPFRCLGRSRIGRRALLRRNGYNNAGNGPLDLLGLNGTVPPLVVGGRSKCGFVIACVSSRSVSANGQLTDVVVGPGGSLRFAVGRQYIVLHRKRSDDRPVNDPLNRDLVQAAGELISIRQIKPCGIGPSVHAVGRAGNGHLRRIIPSPGRSFSSPVIGKDSILNRDSHLNGVDCNIQAGGLGHTLIGITDLHRTAPQSRESGLGIGVSRNLLRRVIREFGSNHHSRRGKFLQIVIDHLGGVVGNGNGYQHLLHSNRHTCRLGDAAFGIGDNHLRHPIR